MHLGKGRPSAPSAAVPGRLTRPPGRGMVTGMETVFDTLAYTRRLTQAGVEDKHAEALTDALRAAFSEGVATRADIARLESRMDAQDAKLDAQDAKLDAQDAKLDALDAKLDANMRAVQWVLGLVVILLVTVTARLFGAI